MLSPPAVSCFYIHKTHAEVKGSLGSSISVREARKGQSSKILSNACFSAAGATKEPVLHASKQTEDVTCEMFIKLHMTLMSVRHSWSATGASRARTRSKSSNEAALGWTSQIKKSKQKEKYEINKADGHIRPYATVMRVQTLHSCPKLLPVTFQLQTAVRRLSRRSNVYPQLSPQLIN